MTIPLSFLVTFRTFTRSDTEALAHHAHNTVSRGSSSCTPEPYPDTSRGGIVSFRGSLGPEWMFQAPRLVIRPAFNPLHLPLVLLIPTTPVSLSLADLWWTSPSSISSSQWSSLAHWLLFFIHPSRSWKLFLPRAALPLCRPYYTRLPLWSQRCLISETFAVLTGSLSLNCLSRVTMCSA